MPVTQIAAELAQYRTGSRFDGDDFHSAALCAWKEARGDGEEACAAVLWVISNRSWDWHESVHQVIYGKNQFSSMSVPSDPEFNLQPEENDPIFQFCMDAAAAILRRLGVDPTGRAHYYANLHTAHSPWFAQNVVADQMNHPLKATIGKQSFFL